MIKPDFWDTQADNYPAYDDEYLAKDSKVSIEFLKSNCEVKNKSILDIGTGTGALAIPLASEAKEVYCIDFSQGMLKRLEESAKELGLENITTKHSTWDEIYKNSPIKKGYDISIASFTPAVRTKEDLEAMIEATKEACLYASGAGDKVNRVRNELFLLHGYEKESKRSKDGVGRTLKLLKEMGYDVKEHYFYTEWVNTHSFETALSQAIGFFEFDGLEYDEKIIREYLKKITDKDGNIYFNTKSKKGILFWRV